MSKETGGSSPAVQPDAAQASKPAVVEGGGRCDNLCEKHRPEGDMSNVSERPVPVREIARGLRDCTIAAQALAEAACDVFRQRGSQDNAYATWTGELATETATEVDRLLALGHDTGPFMGILLSVKDVFGVPGLPIYAGLGERLPEAFEAPGAVVRGTLRQLPSMMGKTHTVPLAFGGLGLSAVRGTPRNPWDAESHRAPGGSSSGAGVSVVTGTARLAFGSDTHGSVRVPAAMTGVAGLKVTGGRWPTDGMVPLSSTLDTPGLLALTCDDLSFGFAAVEAGLGRAEAEPAPPDLAGLTLGVADDFFWDGCSPGVAETVKDVMLQIERAGARLVPVEIPGSAEIFEIFQAGGLAASELAAFLQDALPDVRQKLEPHIEARIAAAEGLPAVEYIRRCRRAEACAREAAERLAAVDAVLMPTVAVTTPRLAEVEEAEAYARVNMQALRNASIVNFLSLCAITLPAGRDAAGMPVGLHLVARPWSEPRLLAIGRAIESCVGAGPVLLGDPPALPV
jgi:aspartyl-tRNA(Asn)/glutamyl-tRNA(Gln) amidotransferase subunit A